MGNCMRKNNQISSAQDENEEAGNKVEQIKTTTSSSSSKLELAPRDEIMRNKKKKKKKKVRFNIQDGRESDHSDSSDGVRRIRLVVTKEELKQILSYKNDVQHTSLEQLLSDMKLRERRLYKVEECDGGMNSWRPGLESIPEDRSINEVAC